MRDRLLRSFLAARDGATALEYGMIAAVVAVGIIASLSQFRDGLITILTVASNNFKP